MSAVHIHTAVALRRVSHTLKTPSRKTSPLDRPGVTLRASAPLAQLRCWPRKPPSETRWKSRYLDADAVRWTVGTIIAKMKKVSSVFRSLRLSGQTKSVNEIKVSVDPTYYINVSQKNIDLSFIISINKWTRSFNSLSKPWPSRRSGRARDRN